MDKEFKAIYATYKTAGELDETDHKLVLEARKATQKAYAPYSQFHVGAALILANGQILSAANQENASYPAGTCAERTLLGTVSSVATGQPIITMAVSYHNLNGKSFDPISPCGICRQVLLEQEKRQQSRIRIILTGYEANSPVIVLPTAETLLPFAFSSESME